MKAGDLMVGNWVFDKVKQRNVIIWGISENHNFVWVNYANGVGVYTRDFDEIEPISLSEEILLKCGFEKGRFGSYFMTLANEFSKLTYWKDQNATELNNTHGTRWGQIHCEYLHELQQLYKILTKQELEIKL